MKKGTIFLVLMFVALIFVGHVMPLYIANAQEEPAVGTPQDQVVVEQSSGIAKKEFQYKKPGMSESTYSIEELQLIELKKINQNLVDLKRIWQNH